MLQYEHGEKTIHATKGASQMCSDPTSVAEPYRSRMQGKPYHPYIDGHIRICFQFEFENTFKHVQSRSDYDIYISTMNHSLTKRHFTHNLLCNWTSIPGSIPCQTSMKCDTPAAVGWCSGALYRLQQGY